MFREAVRVPRHAFSPNVTGALGTPLDFLVKLGLRFYLEDLVFWDEMNAKYHVQKPYYCGLGLFATFLVMTASPIRLNLLQTRFWRVRTARLQRSPECADGHSFLVRTARLTATKDRPSLKLRVLGFGFY